jgi:cytochrome b561
MEQVSRRSGEAGMPEDVTDGSVAAPRYGTVARLFHWVMATLVTLQILAGIAMTSEPLAGVVETLGIYVYHKGAGAVLLMLVVGRLLWRVTHRPPPFPNFMPPLEKRIAGATHWTIYVLLLAMTLSGYVHVIGGQYPIELLDALGVPPLLPAMPRAAAAALVLHRFAVFGLVSLVAVHVAMVIRHQVIDRNPVLRRMWPPFGG